MILRNESEHTVKVDGHQLRHVVKPGEEVDIAPEYCRAHFVGNGSRVPSTMEQLAPQLTPTREQDWALYKGDPEGHFPMTPRQPGPRTASERQVPAGVAEVLAQQKAAAVEKSLAAKSGK